MKKVQKAKTYAEFQQLLSQAKILDASGDWEGAERLFMEAYDATPRRDYWRMWAGEGRHPFEEWVQASAQHCWVEAATGE